MADLKISQLTAITTLTPATDVLPVVDVTGTTKKITTNQILGSGGTATLASATITGALGAAGLNVTGSTIPANGVYLGSANNLSFSAASTLGMTLNSTGLTIGGSAIGKLTAYSTTNGDVLAAFRCTGTGTQRGLYISADNSTGIVSVDATGAAAGILQFKAGGTNTMQIDSSGNVGVGVTPSAWGNNSKALQVAGGSASVSSTGAGSTASRFAHGAYFDNTNWLYQYTGVGPALYQVTGANAGSTHAWYIAPGGTAGNAITFTQAMTLDGSGNLLVGTTSGSLHKFQKAIAVATGLFEISSSSTGSRSLLAYSADAEGWSANTPAIFIGKYSVTGRSINAGGTLNASGADYAEYMVKCSDFVLAKGDVAGIDANGKLTNVFADAISFVVKSTDPSYVGNDKWGIDLEGDALEAARQLVDRIAFAGQVPVNVTGAKAGDYIVPVVDGTGIKGISVSNPTFDQYQLAVGKVIGIDADGRARIIVKVA